jgi:hypothetical protein
VAANRSVSEATFFAGYKRLETPTANAYATFSVQPVSVSTPVPGVEADVVYNLEVGGAHTFFVGEHGVLVHNY